MIKNMICNEPFHDDCFMRNQCQKYNVCPMALVQELFSGKYKLLILWYLSQNTLRFSDIKKRIPQITQKMLTAQLRSMEEDKLINRKVYPVVPPKVEYSLTEVGQRLIPILELMHSFGSRYLDEGIFNDDSQND